MIHKVLNQEGLSYFRFVVGEAGLHTLHIFTHQKHASFARKSSEINMRYGQLFTPISFPNVITHNPQLNRSQFPRHLTALK